MNERHPPIRALSLFQPWASAWARGVKRNETRSWSTSYRGLLLIHASGKVPDDVAHWLERDAEMRELCARPELDHRSLPKGAVVGVAYLADVLPTGTFALEERLAALGEDAAEERLWGDFSSGRYAWLARGQRELIYPVPARGYPGLWTPSPDLIRAVDRAGEGILSRLGIVV